jgi:nucleotide-binding universal stress UspA family protein
VEKILVTTDFSDHSKSGLRFAVQLAAQNAYHLTFLNVHHLQPPSAWDAVRMDEYEDEQKELIHTKLVHFVEKIYAKMHINPQHIQYAVELSVFPESGIVEYAEKYTYDYICISTRGTGMLKKILGTITSSLIHESKVPVMVIPHDYEPSKIIAIMYSSDFEDYEHEIIRVVSFAKPLGASVELLNFTSISFKEENRNIVEKRIKKIANYPVSIYIRHKKEGDNLIEAIEAAVQKVQPSVLVMFTQQNRNWFENIFYAGNSEEYSFHTKVPLLVFRKS